MYPMTAIWCLVYVLATTHRVTISAYSQYSCGCQESYMTGLRTVYIDSFDIYSSSASWTIGDLCREGAGADVKTVADFA